MRESARAARVAESGAGSATEYSEPVNRDDDASELSLGPATEERAARYAVMRARAASAQLSRRAADPVESSRGDRTAATIVVDEDEDITQLPLSQQRLYRARAARGSVRNGATASPRSSNALPPGYSIVHSLSPDSDSVLSASERAGGKDEDEEERRLDVTVAVRRASARRRPLTPALPAILFSAACSLARHHPPVDGPRFSQYFFCLPSRNTSFVCRAILLLFPVSRAVQFVATDAIAESPLFVGRDTEHTDDGADAARSVAGAVGARGGGQLTRVGAMAVARSSSPSPLPLASEGVTQLGLTLTPDDETQTQVQPAR